MGKLPKTVKNTIDESPSKIYSKYERKLKISSVKSSLESLSAIKCPKTARSMIKHRSQDSSKFTDGTVASRIMPTMQIKTVKNESKSFIEFDQDQGNELVHTERRQISSFCQPNSNETRHRRHNSRYEFPQPNNFS